jgi:hypothetical protein
MLHADTVFRTDGSTELGADSSPERCTKRDEPDPDYRAEYVADDYAD